MSIKRGLNYAWRLAVTGACFAGFSAGSAVLVFLFVPLLWVLRGGPAARRRRARWLIHKAFGLMLGVLRLGGVMTLEHSGVQALASRRNTLILANHPTLIDVVALLALVPDATCVVKSALWRHPFIGGVVRAAGYISNDAPESFIDASAEALRAGGTLVIFPEGTRSRPGMPFRFQRGAAYVALKSGSAILPVVITCDPPTLTKAHKWFEIPERAFHLALAVKAAQPLSAWIEADAPSSPATARRLTHTLQNYFTQELCRS